MTGLSQLPICSSKTDKDIYIQVVKQSYDINSILGFVWDMIRYLLSGIELLSFIIVNKSLEYTLFS